jgi:ribonucleoside-diphosphate reductase alpha chain
VCAADAKLRWHDEEVARFLTQRGVEAEGLAALASGVPAADLPGLDDDARALLRRGHEIDAEAQLAVQARFQRRVDGAISKTVHLPAGASAEQIEALALRARELGCKGAAFYVGGALCAPQIEQVAFSCAECAI